MSSREFAVLFQRTPAHLTRARVCRSRLYHSYDHFPYQPYTPSQEKILSSALKHVPEYGFAKQSLVQGCRDAGYLDTTHAVFQGGVFDLVKFHLYKERQKLAALKPQIDEEEGKSVGKRIRRYCVERLKANEPIISKWTEAIAIMALPQNIPQSLEELAKLSDEIWFLVDDKASDFDWYTKRASLSAVYSSTELYMTQDNSPGFENTYEFLDRRLAGVQSAGSSISSMMTWATFTGIASINLLQSQLSRG
ncbi:ubiquinone biosynthesis protein COQ9 [Lipomyces kononenkoae]|uniref:Ubiquinone biosynthesis protein COQ9 n=1 Tax=Lipomyces kononenkoae TaxID=34357 RepID=A0ACC3T0E5_LIPKO